MDRPPGAAEARGEQQGQGTGAGKLIAHASFRWGPKGEDAWTRALLEQNERRKCAVLGQTYKPLFSESNDPPQLWAENILAVVIFTEAWPRPERSGFGDVMGYDRAFVDRLLQKHDVPAERLDEVWQKLDLLRPLLWWRPETEGYEP